MQTSQHSVTPNPNSQAQLHTLISD